MGKIVVGQKAPQFEAVDIFGKKIKLSDYKNKYTLVVFLRYAGCPWCNLAIHRLSLEQKLLSSSRCEIIAFLQSSPENIKENIFERHAHAPKFPVIADQEEKYYGLYDVKTSLKALIKSITKIPHWIYSVTELGFSQKKVDGNWLMVPAVFLVSDGDQKIIKASYSSSFYDNETFTDIYQSLIFGRANDSDLLTEGTTKV